MVIKTTLTAKNYNATLKPKLQLYQGDIGESITDKSKEVDGEIIYYALIPIEALFKETVNLEKNYQVFITKYGRGDLWIEKRSDKYFMVRSEFPNVSFGWELKAKQKGYENTRLQSFI